MTEPTTIHSNGAGVVRIADIIVGEDRYRIDTPEVRKSIEENLVPLIADKGLIHPIVVSIQDDGTFKLVAGWRRMIAMQLLGHEYIPYVFRSNLGEVDVAELEIDENLGRENPPFKDQVLGIYRVHKLRMLHGGTKDDPWTQKKTGDLLNTTAGNISELLTVAKLIEKGDTELAACVSLFDTRRILAKRRLDQAAAHLKQLHQNSIGTTVEPPKSDKPKISLVGDDAPSSSRLEVVTGAPKLRVPITSWMLNMDNRIWFDNQKPESIDGIYTDIPYGIPVKDIDTQNLSRVEDAHDESENVSQFPIFIKGAWKVLREGSYLIFWYDLRHHNLLVNLLEETGFTVQKWPLLWLKPSGQNKAASTWWTKAVEYVMVARKGNATLLQPQPLNYKYASAAAERKIYLNPFFKSWEISKWILEPLVHPGSTWLDCYAGEGSLIKVLLDLHAKVISIEKEESHYNRSLEHTKAQIRLQLKGDVEFV